MRKCKGRLFEVTLSSYNDADVWNGKVEEGSRMAHALRSRSLHAIGDDGHICCTV